MMPSLDDLGDLPTQDQTPGQAPTQIPEGENPTNAGNTSQPGPEPQLSTSEKEADKNAADAALASTADPAKAGAKRSDALTRSRTGKMEKLFRGKTFRVIRPVNLGKDQVFETPLGNKGRNGFLLEEIDASGAGVQVDGKPHRFTVGATTLKLMHEQYAPVQGYEEATAKPAKAPKTPEPAQEPAPVGAPAPE